MYIKHVIFQSTRPSRASTLAAQSGNWSVWQFQSTRPSRASTRLREVESRYDKFQSTRPSRASTRQLFLSKINRVISIHKALAGLDITSQG